MVRMTVDGRSALYRVVHVWYNGRRRTQTTSHSFDRERKPGRNAVVPDAARCMSFVRCVRLLTL